MLDVIVANQRGPLLLYRNEVAPGRGWIGFDLEGACRSGCVDPPAAPTERDRRQVTLFWNGQQQVQEVSGGSGFCSQNQRRLQFGLGAGRGHRKGRRALAVWQSRRSCSHPEANRVHKIEEPA